ncbi:hypothetical protein BOX15_Mlig008135g1 [Macrostomum lignano]|uniref:Ig-like domain-containing protein n=1 Tax=Macrostomum lignano TaxID=282301 RepID=A0A267DB54_9PLAT|nr:hypothetical protein BOX15_Mlig008135g2 [Macrostomum lignano]PAA53869.1 hypothetical protein BOX15_Mlig008135g1 [Macrostomum lignano]
MRSPLHLLLAAMAVLNLPQPVRCSCSDPLFSPLTAIRRDAFLLTEGESLRLSCGVCGDCLPASDSRCYDHKNQVWMSDEDRQKAQIRSRTKTKPATGGGTGKQGSNAKLGKRQRFRNFMKRMKERAHRAKKRLLKVALTTRRYMEIAVQRFDRLRRLGFESDSGVGILKELWSPTASDSELQWFVETADGQVSKVKHESGGRVLIFDMLVISRANLGSTGLYTCQFRGKMRARFVVTVVAGGVEPYREFEPGSGRSLQPKLLSKGNLEVYTRWMDQTRSLLLQIPNSLIVNGTVSAYNLSITWGICYVKQLDADRPVVPEGNPLLKLIPQGLPCRSHLLPVSVRSLRSVIKRPSETRKIRTHVRVHFSEFSFGLTETKYTTVSPPPLSVESSLIKRSFMIAKQGEFVSLQCPLTRTLRTLIAWFTLPNDTERLRIETAEIVAGIMDPYSLRENSSGRVFTDPGGNLNIADVKKTQDQRKYYCLHKGRVVGYVNLIIRHAKEESHIMYITSLVMNVLRVASPLVITASIIFLTLVSASNMFEPQVPW